MELIKCLIAILTVYADSGVDSPLNSVLVEMVEDEILTMDRAELTSQLSAVAGSLFGLSDSLCYDRENRIPALIEYLKRANELLNTPEDN